MEHVTWNITFWIFILVFSFAFLTPAYAEDETETATPQPEAGQPLAEEIISPVIEETVPPVEMPTTTPTPEPETTAPTSTLLIETTTTIVTTTLITNDLITDDKITDTVNKILNYLKSQQSEDGKIIDGTITDWAIMSFGANGQYADEIKMSTTSLLDYEKKYNLDDPSDLNSCATYPRHILALLAAGVEQSDPAILGLKEKMNTVCYKNNLYGLNGINDDIFALLALSALDINQTESIMQDIVSTTLAWQMENGAFSWPDWMDPNSKVAGDDITGAAINALKYATTKGAVIDTAIIDKAKNYLKSTQQTDGGWGYGASDVMTTGWVLMGINSLGENQNEWFVTSTGKNPWYPLVNDLKTGGFYESAWVPGTVDWFAMKHAVPALLGKSWPITLAPKVTNFSEGATFTYGGGGGSSYIPPIVETPTTTPTTTTFVVTPTSTTSTIFTTTTLEITTSTLDFATSTIATTTIEQYNNITTTTPTIKPKLQVISYKLQNDNNQIPNPNPIELAPLATGQALSSAPPETPPEPTSPVSSAAKKLFAGSSIAAGGLGLYLAWRLLQTVV